jgi:NADH-quinone oxidoreductase subunit E
MQIPAAKVAGVASFYHYYRLQPRGRFLINVCLGTACYVKGIKEVMARIGSVYNVKEGDITEDRRFGLEGVRCLGACGLAPVMVVGEDTHGAVTSDKVIDILERYE